MAVVFSVDDDDGADRAAAEAGDGLQGELVVLGCMAGGDVEPPLEFLEDPRAAPDVAGRAQADQAGVLAAGGEAEGAVERGDADMTSISGISSAAATSQRASGGRYFRSAWMSSRIAIRFFLRPWCRSMMAWI